jgi:rhodanese-related sulfurtransferase
MEELKRTKRITIGVVVFVVVVIIGFITFKKPLHVYQYSPAEMAEELYLVYQVTPEEAMELMFDSTAAVFIDIRSIYDFEKGHLENAINIPVANLLDEAYKSRFDQWLQDSTLVVLYGNDELQANAPWMLMYQLGYTNTRTLMGGIGYIDKLYEDALAENETFMVEDPAFNFADIIKAGSLNSNESVVNTPKKQVVIRKKKKKAAEGGC